MLLFDDYPRSLKWPFLLLQTRVKLNWNFLSTCKSRTDPSSFPSILIKIFNSITTKCEEINLFYTLPSTAQWHETSSTMRAHSVSLSQISKWISSATACPSANPSCWCPVATYHCGASAVQWWNRWRLEVDEQLRIHRKSHWLWTRHIIRWLTFWISKSLLI